MPHPTNITIIAPEGTSQHNRDGYLCLPAGWLTILQFFIANYLAHAFTIWFRPGEKTADRVVASILAFLFPVTGLARGIDAIHRHASFHSTLRNLFNKYLRIGPAIDSEVLTAARSGALGILVRTPEFGNNSNGWKKKRGSLRGSLYDKKSLPSSTNNRLANQTNARFEWDPVRRQSHPLQRCSIRQSFAVVVSETGDKTNTNDLRWTRDVFGLVSKYEFGYRVMELPGTMASEITLPDEITPADEKIYKLNISPSSSSLQVLIAIGQICYASYELSQNSGDQFDRFGYSAFILTVVPYVLMSFINLVGNLVTPSYPNMYLVGTSVMAEAKHRGFCCEGSIGTIDDKSLEGPTDIVEVKVIDTPCSNSQGHLPGTSFELLPECSPDSLRICFLRGCQYPDQHRYCLRVPSGQPKHKETSSFLFKGIMLLLALALPIGIVIWVLLRYPRPQSVVHMFVLPLWLFVGDVLGIYIMYIGLDVLLLRGLTVLIKSGFPGVELSDKEKGYIFQHKRELRVLLAMLLVGLVTAIANFYLVAIQILAFGNCRKMSDG